MNKRSLQLKRLIHGWVISMDCTSFYIRGVNIATWVNILCTENDTSLKHARDVWHVCQTLVTVLEMDFKERPFPPNIEAPWTGFKRGLNKVTESLSVLSLTVTLLHRLTLHYVWRVNAVKMRRSQGRTLCKTGIKGTVLPPFPQRA